MQEKMARFKKTRTFASSANDISEKQRRHGEKNSILKFSLLF